MNKVFVDTFYWVEKIRPDSKWAVKIREAESQVRGYRLVTTDDVLTEFLNTYSEYGVFWRQKAVDLVKRLLSTSTVQLIPQTRESFRKGVERYEARKDKKYSLVDCISMNAMEKECVREILTEDHHFEQEGFVVLLRK